MTVVIAGPIPVSSHYNGKPGLVEGAEGGHNGEIGAENRSLFSCRRIPCSVSALSRYCGRRLTHPRMVDLDAATPLANVCADDVSRGGRRYDRSSHCLSDFRSDECGRIRRGGGRLSLCLSSVSLASELTVA